MTIYNGAAINGFKIGNKLYGQATGSGKPITIKDFDGEITLYEVSVGNDFTGNAFCVRYIRFSYKGNIYETGENVNASTEFEKA